MSYNLLACDLDDTLIDDFGIISDKNREAIDKLENVGKKFMLVTGRAYKSVLPFYKSLGLKTPVITLGGAQVFDKDGALIYKSLLPTDTAKALLRHAAKRNMHAQVYIGDNIQYLKECEEAKYYTEYTKLKGIENKNLLEEDFETSKVVFITDENKVPEEMEIIKEEFPELSILRSKGRLIEAFTRKVSKGNALKETIKLMGYHQDEVIAVGDSTIDLSMLEFAALSAAPLNSLTEVKAAADVILKSNNESCISELIERYML